MRYLRIILLSVLISLSSSYIIMTSIIWSTGDVMSGADLVEEVVLAIVLGLAIGCLSLLFYIERWAFSQQLLVHFIGICVLVYTVGAIGGWYDVQQLASVARIFGTIILIYVISWGIVRSFTKQTVADMNAVLKEKQEGTK